MIDELNVETLYKYLPHTQKTEPDKIRRNQKKLRITQHLAVYFLPVFSLLFIFIFFVVGLTNSSLNQ